MAGDSRWQDNKAGTALPVSPSTLQLFCDDGAGFGGARRTSKDGGLDGSEFLKAIDRGTLPQVAFYKPQGSLNKHAGYADLLTGDRHIADVITHLEKSPQWPQMLVIVTYDENGGFGMMLPPPKGDRWGPGTRVPTLIVSPFAKKALRRSYAVRHDVDLAVRHQAFRLADASGFASPRPRARGQW